MKYYSVLMSVYYKENPDFLRQAIESMLCQSVKTNDFVLVCDGPLTLELDAVITEFEKEYPHLFDVVRLEKNSGLGNALNAGLVKCRNELIARMDSDDISCADRCEKQLRAFRENPGLSIVSGTVIEFSDTQEKPAGKRILPGKHEEILKFSRKRNPFNHPAVMFKKGAVETVGGYSEKFPLFEDYYLWVRMLKSNAIGENLQDVLVNMRTPSDMFKRRGGKAYAKNMLKFHRWMLKSKWTTLCDFITGAVPHALVCVMPNGMRKAVYKLLHS